MLGLPDSCPTPTHPVSETPASTQERSQNYPPQEDTALDSRGAGPAVTHSSVHTNNNPTEQLGQGPGIGAALPHREARSLRKKDTESPRKLTGGQDGPAEETRKGESAATIFQLRLHPRPKEREWPGALNPLNGRRASAQASLSALSHHSLQQGHERLVLPLVTSLLHNEHPQFLGLFPSVPMIFSSRVAKYFKACNTWLFSQEHGPLLLVCRGSNTKMPQRPPSRERTQAIPSPHP